MIRRILTVGVTVAAVVGVGTGALALTGQTAQTATPGTGTTTSSTPSSDHSKKADQKGHKLAKALLHHAVHGQVVTKGKSGYERHDGIAGTVAAVTAHSITVTASDGYRETFVVGSDTKVRHRADGKGSKSTITAVHSGDTVAVIGKATAGSHQAATAGLIVDGISR